MNPVQSSHREHDEFACGRSGVVFLVDLSVASTRVGSIDSISFDPAEGSGFGQNKSKGLPSSSSAGCERTDPELSTVIASLFTACSLQYKEKKG